MSVSDTTREAYRIWAESVAKARGYGSAEELALKPEGVIEAELLRYREDMVRAGSPASTINPRLRGIEWYVESACGLVIKTPRVKPRPKITGTSISSELVSLMIDAIDRRNLLKATRDELIVRLIRTEDMKRGVLLGLRMDDSREGWSPKTEAAFQAWQQESGQTIGPMFVSVSNRKSDGCLSGAAVGQVVAKLGEAVGVDINPEQLRQIPRDERREV